MTGPDRRRPAGEDASELDRALQDLTDDARVEASASTRRTSGSLRRQAAEEGTLAGAMLDLAERHEHLVVSTAGGTTLRGTVCIIGRDFVALRSPNGERTWVPTGRIASVRTEPTVTRTAGDRVVQVTETLRGHLGSLTDERPWVSLRPDSAETIGGTLVGVGQDLLTVRSEQGTTTYVATARIDHLTIR